MTWITKWSVPGSKGKTWTVAINDSGEFGCSCPVWRFKRQECKHIRKIKEQSSFLSNLKIMNNKKISIGQVGQFIPTNFIPAVKVGRNFNFNE